MSSREDNAGRREILKDFFGSSEQAAPPEAWVDKLVQFEKLMVKYRAAIREVTTKLEVLSDEFSVSAKRNPIESIQSRIKRPYSIARKLRSMGQPAKVEAIQACLNDVAGVRVICPFLDDIYAIADMLLSQDDIRLVRKKDYIQSPKPNGYRSLHLIIDIPVFFSSGKELMRAEIQIRTVAMNFWASLEHQIQYKSGLPAGQDIQAELLACADRIAETDRQMFRLRNRISQAAEPDYIESVQRGQSVKKVVS